MQPASPGSLKRQSFEDLRGWATDDHDAALQTFRRSCREILQVGSGFGRPVTFGGARDDWLELCHDAMESTSAKSYFERHFTPFRVIDEVRPDGLFTGYYEPEVEGSRTPDKTFTVPVYRRPADLVRLNKQQKSLSGFEYGRLVNDQPIAYFSRKEIELGALHGQVLELAWLKDWADAFFMQVQGSGRIRFADGSVMRLSYSAKSGHEYTGIGALLVNRGVLTREQMSMQAIRAWMREHSAEARQLMWENESFVFFREVQLEQSSLGGLGAQQIQLTPERSLAVDRKYWMFGTPVWLETRAPFAAHGKPQVFKRLLIAQDTGSAIVGLARGDVFWGFGEDAAHVAGLMKSPGEMTVLLPKAVARRLRLIP